MSQILMKLSIIAAVAKNNVIGAKNQLPWYIPEDLKHFKEITTGHTVLVGRKTFESIIKKLGHPLPNRKNVVVTRKLGYKVTDGVEVYNSVEEALEKLRDEDVYIIGGGEIYAQTIDKADTLYITHIDKKIEGDTYFPKINWNDWTLVSEEKHEGFSFATYKRK